MAMRKCPSCLAMLPADLFAKDASKRSGLKSVCRACDARRCKEYYAANQAERLAVVNARNAAIRAAKQPRPCKVCESPTPSHRHWYCNACRPKRRRESERSRNGQRDRPDATKRGYGNAHQKMRRRLKPSVDAGEVSCARCGMLIVPGEPWDLGHDDLDRSRYQGPEHRSCNRATASHKRERRKAMFSRVW